MKPKVRIAHKNTIPALEKQSENRPLAPGSADWLADRLNLYLDEQFEFLKLHIGKILDDANRLVHQTVDLINAQGARSTIRQLRQDCNQKHRLAESLIKRIAPLIRARREPGGVRKFIALVRCGEMKVAGNRFVWAGLPAGIEVAVYRQAGQKNNENN
jgi:hypothetical protein